MRRPVRYALLSLLLLFLQWQGHVHPIAHMAPVGAERQDTALQAPQAPDDCLECALLASGTLASAGDAPAAVAAAAASAADPVACAHRASDACAWFESRAPPVLL